MMPFLAGVRPAREAIMAALFDVLVASLQVSFTADTAAGSVILANPSAMAGLFVGLPVFGGTIPRGSIIDNLAPLTISQAPSANTKAVALSTGFLTVDRRFVHWDQVSAQPALFLVSGDEENQYQNGTMQKLVIGAEVWIYSNLGQSPSISPETPLNNMLDAVQAAFAPDDARGGRFTLGGLVEWCRLEGKIEKEPGYTGTQAIAVADVQITVP